MREETLGYLISLHIYTAMYGLIRVEFYLDIGFPSLLNGLNKEFACKLANFASIVLFFVGVEESDK